MLIRDVLTKILHKLSQPKLKFGAQIRRHFSHKIMLPKFDCQKAIKLLAKFAQKQLPKIFSEICHVIWGYIFKIFGLLVTLFSSDRRHGCIHRPFSFSSGILGIGESEQEILIESHPRPLFSTF